MAKFDFSGWATRFNTKCSDGRTILSTAFDDNDGQTVPLVWQHQHDSPANILGHALLEKREDGMYTYCTFNDTELGQNAKELVAHGDITSLSIYANRLKETKGEVAHGMIREVSLVLTGANPGAYIETVSISHDASGEFDAVIYNDEESLSHGEGKEEDMDEGRTVQEIYDTLSEEQVELVNFLVGAALQAQAAELSHADKDDEDEYEEKDKEEAEESEKDEDKESDKSKVKDKAKKIIDKLKSRIKHDGSEITEEELEILNTIVERADEFDAEDMEFAEAFLDNFIDE